MLTLVGLAKAGDLYEVWELLLELLNNHEAIMVAVVVAEARNDQLMLHLVTELCAVLHFLCQRLLPCYVFFAISVTLYLHDKLLNLGEVPVSVGDTREHG